MFFVQKNAGIMAEYAVIVERHQHALINITISTILRFPSFHITNPCLMLV